MRRLEESLLRAGELHLWLLSPEALAAAAEAAVLSLDEKAWVRAMPTDAGRSWAARRSALRQILAAYLERSAESIDIVRGPLGKPVLALPALHFNLSESQGWALVALCADQPVGVDIEVERPDLGAWAVARRYFQEPELAVLAAAERSGGLLPAFLRLWTRREARLKIWGSGLRELDALADEGLLTPESRAWVEDLCPAPGVFAAVALPLAPTWLRVMPWQPNGASAMALAQPQAEGAWKA